MKNRAQLLFVSLTVLFASIYIVGCKKTDLKLSTTEDVNIYGYLKKSPDSFSLIQEILDKTENGAFLDAYGSYTFFAPSNSGVKAWFNSIGAADVNAVDINTLKEMVRFHLLADTVTTGSFKDGKLPVPTMQSQFLITGVAFDAGASSFSINRQAMVSKSNIKVGNGIIHVIDNVLKPATLTIARQLEANPNYSIFVQAMKETGYYDLLNKVDSDTAKRWMTVIAESNRALADAGITSFAALKARYSNTGNPTNAKDSLHMYMSYHILNGIKFLGDIITASSHITLEPQEVISTQLIGQDVKVNEDVFNGVTEPGVVLPRPTSDNSATNGVWHDAHKHFMVKYRKPTAVYWDMAMFPELMKLPSYYRKQDYTFTRQSEIDYPIKDIDWEYKKDAAFLAYYYNASTSATWTNYAYNNDLIRLALGGPNRSLWAEFTTPVIIKGRYKVWVCYRAASRLPTCNVVVNGEILQRPINFSQERPAGTPEELESIGWKQYTENSRGVFNGRLAGIVDIRTTERHKLRLEAISASDQIALDMIHFIPVDEDQIYPRFRPDGTKVFK